MAGKKLPKGYRHAITAGNSQARITFSGPLFSADADKTLRQNIRRMMQGIADEGAEVAKARSPRRSGAFIDGIEGRTQGVRGNKWALTAVVSQTHVYPWHNKGARGFSGRAQAEYRGGKVEQRYRIFRAVTSQLRAARAVMAANLTKGLE
jgi:hypothetical protein